MILDPRDPRGGAAADSEETRAGEQKDGAARDGGRGRAGPVSGDLLLKEKRRFWWVQVQGEK